MAASPSSVVDISVGDNARYVDWAAILAGAILASAISFVLFTFGTGIGLSLTSPYPGESVRPVIFALALGLWVLWVSVSSFIAGAYFTGRLRRRIGDASPHEVEVRDAAHGLLVWAVSVLLGAFIAAWTASKTADVAAGAATGASAAAAQHVVEGFNPVSYWTDVLFRPAAASAAGVTTGETTAPAPDTTAGTTTTGQEATAPATPSPANNASAEQSRQFAGRILSTRVTRGKLSDDDRAYLTRIVMDNTGMSETEANARVDQAVAGLYEATEKARKFGILLTFLTAASLAIGAAASWWAAIVGGNHHDQAVDFGSFFGRRAV
jgi:hypothetical protein